LIATDPLLAPNAHHAASLLDVAALISARGLAEMIKVIVQVLDDVLRLNRGEFFFWRMTAVAQLLFQRIQRPNAVIPSSVDASVVAFHTVSVMQELPGGAVARQCGGESGRRQQNE
jgi:hypothetical protein